MSNPIDDRLSAALTARLNLQISISSIPMVEEWMDTNLNRWLESIPMPPEMPSGTPVHFLVGVASDLSRLRWGAVGHPSGMVPKLAEYLSKCQVSPAEVDRINKLGDELAPENVGSWVAIEGGAVTTGWHFLDRQGLDRLAGHLDDDRAKATLLEWAQAQEVVECRRFSRAIGNAPFTDVSLAMPGDQEQQIEAVQSGFSTLAGFRLPGFVETVLRGSPSNLSLVTRLAGGAISRVSVMLSDVREDAAEALCKDAGLGYDEGLRKVQGALSTDGIEWLEYAQLGSEQQVDLHFIPNTRVGSPQTTRN